MPLQVHSVYPCTADWARTVLGCVLEGYPTRLVFGERHQLQPLSEVLQYAQTLAHYLQLDGSNAELLGGTATVLGVRCSWLGARRLLQLQVFHRLGVVGDLFLLT